jgi:enoyl-CoA hydratase/carnithine racemase
MPQVVFAEQSGRVLTVRLDDPPRNFLGSRMVAELDALTRRLEHDRSIGAVILTSAVPDVFVTHADTPEISRRAEAGGWAPTYRQARMLAAVVGPMGRIPQRARRALERTPLGGVLALRRTYEVFARMNRLDKVFIAAIDGLALGGGCILALPAAEELAERLARRSPLAVREIKRCIYGGGSRRSHPRPVSCL